MILLLFACIVTFVGSMARFVTEKTYRHNMEVADFAISARGSEGSVYANDNEYTYSFKVFNYIENKVSEVAISYDVAVTFPYGQFHVLRGAKMILNCNGRETDSLLFEIDRSEYIFRDAGKFAADIKEEHNCVLTFVIVSDIFEKTEIKGIEVFVVARQTE